MSSIPGPARLESPPAATERGSLRALRLMAWLAERLGRPAARWLLHPITLYFLVFAPTPRRHSARYLGRALGRPARWRDLYRHVHTFASTVLDRLYLVRGRLGGLQLVTAGGPLVDECLAGGRGAFLLGAHVGSFEALQTVGSSRPDMRVAMVMDPQRAQMLHSVLHALQPAFALEIIPVGRPGSTLAIRDWLDGGGMAGLLGDRSLPGDRQRSPGVEMPFLGVPARFPDGPLRLAMLLRRRVVFMVALFRGGSRYDVRFEPLADFSTLPSDAAGREALLRRTLADYVARLDALCREAPYNWFNFHDFWREDLDLDRGPVGP